MTREIERKYLVEGSRWKNIKKPPGSLIYQGYLFAGPDKSLRIRLMESAAYLTIKTGDGVLERSEFEYIIPLQDGEHLYQQHTEYRIEKIRYAIPAGDLTWEVDEFKASLEGLVLAEVEIPDIAVEIPLPGWIDKEVTKDKRYLNINLAKKGEIP